VISARDVSTCSYDTILSILIVVRRLNDIGYEFCKSDSLQLQSVIKQSATSFFTNFHNQKLEELQLFLTQEAWEPCPVRHDFDYSHLKGTS
jgi:hypothetical protein